MKLTGAEIFLECLKKVPDVKQVQLLQITADVVEISVQFHGSIESFQKSVGLSQKLALKSQAGQDKLLYEWVH